MRSYLILICFLGISITVRAERFEMEVRGTSGSAKADKDGSGV